MMTCRVYSIHTGPSSQAPLSTFHHSHHSVNIEESLADRLHTAVNAQQSLQNIVWTIMARVCVVLGSVREGRQGAKVANLLMNKLTDLGATPTLLDPLEINPPMLQQPLHFMKV